MKEQLLQKSVKILSLEGNKSNTTVGIQSKEILDTFPLFIVDCLKIRKKRREHHRKCERPFCVGDQSYPNGKRRVSLIMPELFCIWCPDYR